MSFCITTELQCDDCGEHTSNTAGGAFVVAERDGYRREVIEKARAAGWQINPGRHLCPDCTIGPR